MNAMILAAGLGTRLLPITATVPKALAPLCGRPLLAILLTKLQDQGFTHVAVNAHSHAEQMRDFLRDFAAQNDMQLFLSLEPALLDTGGGIKKMLDYFSDEEPVLVHNADVLTTLPYAQLIRAHRESGAAATLAINRRDTRRPLAFTPQGDFVGRSHGHDENALLFGFCGIQVIQPFLFRRIEADRFYSIDAYEWAAQEGWRIRGYDISGYYWRDVGTPDDLLAAEKDVEEKRL